jgi:prepilin-type N-terminal cleavage/methylation domain-containing protein
MTSCIREIALQPRAGDARTPWAGRRPREAFTLAEIMIALTLLSILGAAALSFFIKQTRAVTVTAGRLDAQQNVSFALDEIDHDLRVAGTGLGANQPAVIEAHPYALTFNADLVTTDTASVTTAGYYDPSLPESLTVALTPAHQITYPYSATAYPDSLYLQSTGVISNAETISYWLTLDSITPRPDDYLLLRQVNSAPATVVARGLVFPGGVPAFRYFIPGTAVNSRVEVTPPTLPLFFKVGNVGPDTLLAKISEIELQLQAVYRDPLGHDVYRTVNQFIPVLNAGLLHLSACNSPPLAPTVISTTAWPSGDSIDVTWPASGDETGGNRDVRSYSVYRQTGSSAWGTPIYTAPAAGTGSYNFEDKAVPLGQSYQYGVVARDCTPALSSMTPSGTSVTPNP